MSEIDFIKCMKILHACYLKDFDEDTLEVWYSQLNDIDYQTLLSAIRQISKKSKYMPTISELREFCIEIKDSQAEPLNTDNMKAVCKWCGKIGTFEEIEKHESRHLSLEYIKSRMKKHFGKELTKEQIDNFMKLNQNTFDEWYDDFLEKLIPLTTGAEHERLIKIKETR